MGMGFNKAKPGPGFIAPVTTPIHPVLEISNIIYVIVGNSKEVAMNFAPIRALPSKIILEGASAGLL